MIGGIACHPGREWEDQFISQGGLQYCDVTNYHLYPSRQRAEAAESAFKMRWEQMQQRGQSKPIWVTEFNNGANWTIVASGLTQNVAPGDYWIGLTPLTAFGSQGQNFHAAVTTPRSLSTSRATRKRATMLYAAMAAVSVSG